MDLLLPPSWIVFGSIILAVYLFFILKGIQLMVRARRLDVEAREAGRYSPWGFALRLVYGFLISMSLARLFHSFLAIAAIFLLVSAAITVLELRTIETVKARHELKEIE